MEEKDLKQLWKGNQQDAAKYYHEIENEVEKKAHKRSADILNRVKRSMQTELILSVIVAVIFPFIFWSTPVFFIIMVLLMIIALVLTGKMYLSTLREMRVVMDASLTESLDKRIHILSSFVRRLRVYSFVLAPIGFFVGFAFALSQGDDLTWGKFIFIFLFSLPFLAGFIWLVNKYIVWLYGRPLAKLREIHEGLQSEG